MNASSPSPGTKHVELCWLLDGINFYCKNLQRMLH